MKEAKHIVLLDTDIGDDIDDALALALILKSPEIDLQGVTTVFGDTWCRARLAAHLLHVFGYQSTPVAAGVQQPMQLNHSPSGVPQAAILDECSSYSPLITTTGPDFIIQTAFAHFGQLTLICIGPLTNVATALQKEPRLLMAIRSIFVMGGTGSFPFPEWNIRSDARAAQIVLGSGIPITLVGINVTMRCQLQANDIVRLRDHNTPQTQLLSQLIGIWQLHRPRGHSSRPYLHDPLAVTALSNPSLLTFEKMVARIFTRGPFKGYMVPRIMSGPRINAAVDVRSEQAREWIMQRLL